MTERAVAGSDAAGKSTSSATTLLSPVTKYNHMRRDELLAQQERLKAVRVDRKAQSNTLTAAGTKRKLEIVGVTPQEEGWFADGALAAAAPSVSSSKVGFSKSSVSSSASLAKKQRRTSASRSSTDGGISNVLKNYMKKVEAEKGQRSTAAASAKSPATASASTAAKTKRYLSYDSMAQQALSNKGPGPSKAQFQEKKTSNKAGEMFSRAVVSATEAF